VLVAHGTDTTDHTLLLSAVNNAHGRGTVCRGCGRCANFAGVQDQLVDEFRTRRREFPNPSTRGQPLFPRSFPYLRQERNDTPEARRLQAFQRATRPQRSPEDARPFSHPVHRLMRCTNCEHTFNRDVNACDNMLRIAFAIVKEKRLSARPAYLKRPEHRTEADRAAVAQRTAKVIREEEKRRAQEAAAAQRAPRVTGRRRGATVAGGPAAAQPAAQPPRLAGTRRQRD
jgi:hypothetical protein